LFFLFFFIFFIFTFFLGKTTNAEKGRQANPATKWTRNDSLKYPATKPKGDQQTSTQQIWDWD